MVGYRAGEGGGLLLIQCLLFVWSEVKFVIIHYKDIYNLYFFPKYILQSYFVLTFIEMLHMTLFILFHPQTWVMNILYIFMSNYIQKWFKIFGLIWCNCGGVDIHCVNFSLLNWILHVTCFSITFVLKYFQVHFCHLQCISSIFHSFIHIVHFWW